MMLRNRDLNVQKNVEQPQQLQQNQKRKFQQDQNEKPNKQEAVLPIKRQPAHLVVNGDITAVEEYVQDIFIYYKNRERHFIVSDYMKRQPNLTPSMRAQLVDWIVDMQETLEFYHETLYLAVKLFDLFMDRTKRIVQREKLQLVAAIALFVSAKFDERTVPLIDDLIYLSGDTFTEDEFIKMEREFLTTVSFDLGAPLSYRFLRRLSRVSETTNMDTLTLARYVLELSLLSLQFCRQPESLMAAACFLLAKRIRADEVGNAMDDQWEPVVQASCGYTLAEVEPLMWALNRMLAQRQTKLAKYETIYKKYSHEIFFSVAKCIPLDDNKWKS